MTSAPIELSVPQGPASGSLASGAGAASGDDAQAFAALVDEALGGSGSGPGTSASGSVNGAIDDEGSGDPGSSEETTNPPGLEGVLAALLAAALAPPVTRRALTPSASGTGPAAQAPVGGGGEAPTLPTAAMPDPAPAGTVTSPPPAEVAPTGGTPTSIDASIDPSTTTPDTTPSTTPGTPAPHPGSTSANPAAAEAAAAADTASRPAETSTAPVDGRSVTVTSDVAMRVASGAGLPSTPAGSTTASHPVAAQVIPEITRLVSDGEGVHRVTLQLNPKALGEVRVVLTMRHGDVHVRIAGGIEARQALAASSAELTRALHHVGLDEHRITLTDLPGTTTTTRGGSGSDHTGDSRHHAQTTGGNDPNSRDQNSHHSRMGDARHATDGSGTSSPTERNHASARISAVTHTRPAGEVDLRM